MDSDHQYTCDGEHLGQDEAIVNDPDAIEAGDKVFGPDGFAVVLEVTGATAIVSPIRPGNSQHLHCQTSSLDVVPHEEWVVYEEGIIETPHR